MKLSSEAAFSIDFFAFSMAFSKASLLMYCTTGSAAISIFLGFDIGLFLTRFFPNIVQHIGSSFDDLLRGNIILFIIGQLFSRLRLVSSMVFRMDSVILASIHDNPAVQVPCCPAGSLCKGTL